MGRYPMLKQWRAGSRQAWQGVTRAFRRPRVRISFDIDDTLACLPHHSPEEHSKLPGFVHRWLGEPLRIGTRALIRDLRRQGYSVWIYTSSGRTPSYIRRWLLLYGIRVDGVVNSDRHQHVLNVNGLQNPPSKFPPAFDIDLHVDDSEGVRIEGDDHGFRVVVVCPKDKNWAQKVMDAAVEVQATLAWQQPLRHQVPVQSSSEALLS
ncbi:MULTISPECIES: haloacid dehalogenase-like hydrolase [unclassified Pseudomonas]|uniref:haloacid dehalogenase-like hydrolase n=1 Tax=unclassified Pseudomonas TaxID=196821 RepID=UPI0006D3BC8A